MKKTLILGFIIFNITLLNANAIEWGNVYNILTRTQTIQTPAKTTNTAYAIQALTDFQNKATSIDSTFQNSFLSIVSKLSPPQEANTIKSNFASILNNKNKTTEQKNILISQLISNYTNNLSQNKTSYAEIVKNLSYADKISLANDLATITQSGQQYTILAKQGLTTATNLLKTSSKDAPDLITTIQCLNQTATTIKNRAVTVSNFVSKVKTISKYAGYFI